MIIIPLKDLAARVSGDLQGFRKTAADAVYTGVYMHVLPEAVRQTQSASPRKPVDRGTYIRGFQVAREGDTVVVFNPTTHAAVIEYGRRAGTKAPPVNVLAAWVARKGIAKGKAARSVAFAIAKKMGKSGWPSAPNQPMRILGKAAKQSFPRVIEHIKAALAKFAA